MTRVPLHPLGRLSSGGCTFYHIIIILGHLDYLAWEINDIHYISGVLEFASSAIENVLIQLSGLIRIAKKGRVDAGARITKDPLYSIFKQA